MICPACQTAHAEPAPRFCDGCGLALPRLRRAAPAAAAAPVEIRCAECGLIASSRRCHGCGARVRWPEDVLPPDEQDMGRPPAPALELPDDVGADEVLEVDPGEEK